MNPVYSNDPHSIGQYFSNNSILINQQERIFPFSSVIKSDLDTRKSDEILTVKPRTSVPDKMKSIGTKTSKSCNLSSVAINRFEHPGINVQNPSHIISNEQFRGGTPSRTVVKDNFFKDNKNLYKK